MRRVLVAAAAFLLAALLTLVLPVHEWSTGDQGLMPLEAAHEQAAPPFSRRVWIDTDAACGHAARADPDDCFAIALLARSPEIHIAGISVVGGNAPLEVVERTTRALAAALGLQVSVDSVAGLQAALEQGPLTLLALGPLANVARALEGNPALARNVARIVAVMGRRPGHLFHPAEGAGRGILFGHGPVFRDFNFALDPHAAARVLALDVPMSLVPYDAARGIELTAADLERMRARIPWVVERSKGWLDYWRSDIGREGFYPFDLLAAAYVLEPSWFRCTAVRAWVGEDHTLFIPWSRAALLVEPRTDGPVLYCGRTQSHVKQRMVERIAAN